MNSAYVVRIEQPNEYEIPAITKEQIEQFKEDLKDFTKQDMSLLQQIEKSPEWLLVSESENTKAFYSIERGMYFVAFLSTGDYCMFDEY